MHSISYSKKVKLGTADVTFLADEEYEVVGRLKNLVVMAAFDRDYLEVEVLDRSSYKRGKMKRVMQVNFSKTTKGTWHVDICRVDDKYKGFGVAPRVYRFLMKRLDIVLEAGESQSPGGQYIWAQLAKMPGVLMKAMDRRKNMFDLDSDGYQLESDEVDVYDGYKQIRVMAVCV